MKAPETLLHNPAVTSVESSPRVSIIVPVYNVEAELRQCLISVCFQTIEDYEVIIVNDASPDNSQDIINEFISIFPEKVRCVIHEENQGLAMARRTGVLHARAPYVIFVDSDDMINGVLCERVLDRIVQQEAEICYFPFIRLNMQNGKKEQIYPQKSRGKATVIKNELAAFWHAMYKRDFLLENLDTAFLPMLFEDAAATPMLIDAAESVSNRQGEFMYLYAAGRQNSICDGLLTEKKTEDYCKADLIGWDTISPEYRKAYAQRVIKRAILAVDKFPEVYDYCLRHVNDVLSYTDEYISSYSKAYQQVIDSAKKCVDLETIPKIVYVNGWMMDRVKSIPLYMTQAANSYLFAPQVVVLDETNCDSTLLPSWISDDEEKGLYFAIQRIERDGGIYLSPRLRMITSFNREAFRGAFYVADLRNSVSTLFFGAQAKHPLMSTILNSLNTKCWNSVAECMSMVAIGDYGFHLDGQEEFGRNDTHILPHNATLYSHYPHKNYCVIDEANLLHHEGSHVVIPTEVYEAFQLYVGKTFKAQSEQIQGQKKKLSETNKELKRLYQTPGSVSKQTSAYKPKIKAFLKKIVNRLPMPLANIAYRVWDKVKELRDKE